jgi:phenylacetate-CoA ligase
MLHNLKYQLHRLHHRERYVMLDQLLHNQRLGKTQLIPQQQQALAAIIRHAYDNVPYYHEKYALVLEQAKQNIDPGALPRLHKEEVVQHRDEMLAHGLDRAKLHIGSTGGSTGKPLTFYYDQHKHELMRAGMCRSYMLSGWQPGQKILNFWGAPQDIVSGSGPAKFYQDYIAAEKTISAYQYSESQLHAWAHTIRTYHPVLLQGYASILAELACYILESNITMPRSLVGVFTTAEILHDEQRRKIEQVFQCKVFNQYGSREIPNIACECRHGNLHIFTDMVYLESQRINEEDRLLITSLSNKVMPMIRYDIGDSGLLKDGDCACGSPFPLLEMGLCRSNDLIKTVGGKNVHPSYFNKLLYGKTSIKQYQYVQTEAGKITLNIVCPEKLAIETIHTLQKSVRRDIDADFFLEINYVDEIRRTASGKHRFVLSQLTPQ